MLPSSIIKFINDHEDMINTGDFAAIYEMIVEKYQNTYLFYNCGEFTKALYDAGIDPLHNSSYVFDNFLVSIKFPDFKLPQHIKFLGVSCFCGSDIDEIEIPESITKIPIETFTLGNFNSIILPKSINHIASDAFDDCLVNNIYVYPDTYAAKFVEDRFTTEVIHYRK